MLNSGDKVSSVQQVAERCGLSLITFRRMLATGDGPKITKLSPRRIGIRESHLLEWLDGRLRGQESAATESDHIAA